MKIIFLSHTDSNLYRFRLPVMIELVRLGNEVIALIPKGEDFDKFAKHQIKAISYPINRSSLNPFGALKTIQNIAEILKKEKPDILHTFMLKPNIYGALATKLVSPPISVINSLTGLGSFYIQEGLKAQAFRVLLEFLNRIAFSIAKKVLFQNQDDLELFVTKGLLPQNKAVLIRGSGINTQEFMPLSQEERITYREKLEIPQDSCVVLMIARAIVHKGVREYYQAAKILCKNLSEKKQNNKLVFLYVGGIDRGNIAPITEEFFTQNPQVRYLGHREDIRELLGVCDIFVLPSYREGIPRTLLEAGSMEKPLITTNAVGCKEVVNPDINGFLIEVGDFQNLAQKIALLAEDKPLRESMGKASRQKILEEFAIEPIIQAYLKLYQEVENV
ncbi:MAG: glycosyltransferase family 4 protein [Helicobacter sp.]|nr:glycosyltransferase family 4 protein [Helicobacter sp.]